MNLFILWKVDRFDVFGICVGEVFGKSIHVGARLIRTYARSLGACSAA